MEIIKQGIYALFDGEELVYIGQSNSIYARVGNHIREAVKTFDSFELFPLPDNIDNWCLNGIESALIEWFNPKYNKALIRGKTRTYKSKKNYIKAIQKIIDRELPRYVLEEEYETLPPQFCFCKDCAYNPLNQIAPGAYYMPWQVKQKMENECFIGHLSIASINLFDFDGCMRGLPKQASKYYNCALTEEQKKQYQWYFSRKYSQKTEEEMSEIKEVYS